MKKIIVLSLVILLVFMAGCTQIVGRTTGEADNAALYIAVLDALMPIDEGLNGGMEYISIDVKSLGDVSQEEVQSILQFFNEKYEIDVYDNSVQELYDKGLGDKEKLYLNGIVLSVDETSKLTKTKAEFSCSKYRSGLGAIGVDVKAEKDNGSWIVTDANMTWIS